MEDIHFEKISDEQREEMETQITEAEVVVAIKQMETNRAPGTDGFPIEFYTHFWATTKDDLMSMIIDSILLANEFIDSKVRDGSNGWLFKLDVEKAYDKVNWGFLDTIMSKMGMGQKWRRWIKTLISTTHFSIFLNGTPGNQCNSFRGLPQGDPLSPFLFILFMEGLCKMVQKLEVNGLYKGFTVKANGTQLSHLLFADDTIFFSSDDAQQILNIRALLICFQISSGLSVNPIKSSAIRFGETIFDDVVENSLRCNFEELPIKYLWMPAGAQYRSKNIWDSVVERMEKKLRGWQGMFLSYGGRLVLIKSVLSTLAIYLMSVYSMPTSVEKKINKIMRNFLWGRDATNKKYDLVSWDKVCMDKEFGGLGIRKLQIINDALLCK
ncbi:uncharacterized protein LOC113352781 [Papaver somniferum]|uniref:uncharacterized protein LOC113352781 n=1 Tax=Papaver somniferum TaxID=3469 RepID=UPI000E6F9B07|nr:uncharacterized protein LOC113352781 [Papaver somniferum]